MEDNSTERINSFIENMVVNDPVMYYGNWSSDPENHSNTLFQMFGDKSGGKLRFFLSRGNQQFIDGLIPEEEHVNRTLDSLSGRAIFYNGQHRDMEIDL
jgi:hypothetical protein